MKWYPDLYVGKQAEKKKDVILRRLRWNIGQLDVYLITEASNGKDLFDIVFAGELKQKAVRRNLPRIIGIAKGYGEALELVEQIVMESIDSLGTPDVKRYLREKSKQKNFDGC